MKNLLNIINSKISNKYVVLDGDDHTLCVRERRTGKHFDIIVKECEDCDEIDHTVICKCCKKEILERDANYVTFEDWSKGYICDDCYWEEGEICGDCGRYISHDSDVRMRRGEEDLCCDYCYTKNNGYR